jgi:hypothetical protein
MMGIAPAQFPSSGPHGPGGGNGMLSDNQKKIQQQILRRRAGS